jgi:hypothetical protein
MKAGTKCAQGIATLAREGIGRTLGQMVRAKMALVAICCRCKRRRVLYPANFIPR